MFRRALVIVALWLLPVAAFGQTIGTSSQPQHFLASSAGLELGDQVQGQPTIPLVVQATIGGVGIKSLSLGQNIKANSLPVTIAWDQGVLPVSLQPATLTTQPATVRVVSGTSNTTGATTTSIIAGTPGLRIYVTSFACANTGSTTSLTTFQDGSGGTSLWNTINVTGSGSNLSAGGSPLFWTSAGNGLFFIEGSSSSTAYCSASGFLGT